MSLLSVLLPFGLALFASRPAHAQTTVQELTPALAVKDMLNDTKLKAVAKNGNVCLADVSVTFVSKSSWRTTKSKGLNEASANAYLTLDGVPDETLQGIADKVHDHLAKGLEEAGYTVVPYEKLSAHEKFGNLATDAQPNGKEFALSGLWDALAKMTGATHGRTFSAHGHANLTEPIGSGNYMVEAKIAKGIDAAVAHLEVTLEFATYTVGKSVEYRFRETEYKASLEFEPQLYVSALKFQMIGPDMQAGAMDHNATRYYGANLDYATDFTLLEKIEGVNVTDGLYQVNADTTKYEEAALANANAYVDRIVSSLKGYKN